jgi:hypothetical protein
MTAFEIEFPDYFDKFASETEAKGYFADLTIVAQGRRYRPLFYDVTRFHQEIGDALTATGWFSEANVMVIPAVTRDQIVSAVNKLAEGDFRSLLPEAADATES